MAYPIQNIKIVGSTAGSTLGRTVSNVLNVSIANAFRNIGQFFQSIGIGTRGFNGLVSSGGVSASGTVTFSSLANNDTVTINGVVFTAKTSGATGNNQFNLGVSDTAAAANFALALSSRAAPSKIVNVVTATSAGAIVTITFVESGQIGNLGTLAISAHGSVSGSGVFTGGTDGTTNPLAKGL